MTSRRVQILVPLLVILASAAVYIPSVTYGFVYDDSRQIEMAAPRFDWSYIPSYFTTDIWSFVQAVKSNYYRPAFLIWLLLNYKLFGTDPLPWHISTIAVHLTVVLLLYFLARKLTKDVWIAAIAALIFGLHPAHAEAVAWISGVTEPLFAALGFGTILCHLRARETEQPVMRLRWRTASVALFAVDIFQKETAIVVPVLLFAEWFLRPDSDAQPILDRIRTAIRGLIPYIATVIVYMGLRVMALGGFTPHRSIWSIKMTLWTLPSVAWFYLRALLWPTGFGLFYDLTAVTNPTWQNFWMPLIPVLAACALLLWIMKTSRAAAFAVLLTVVPLLPVLYVRAFSPVDVVHNRYLYVPSAGLAILLGIGLRYLSTKSRATAVGLIGVMAGLLAWGTIRESTPWKSDMTLSTRAMQIAPYSTVAESFYGGSLYLAGRFSEALPHLQASVNSPWVEDKDDILYTVGVCLMRMEAYSTAAADFERVTQIRPAYPQAHLMLGLADIELGQLDNAEFQIREAIRLRPRITIQYQGFHYYLGTVLEKKGDLSGALAEYRAELEETPDMEGLVERIAGLQEKLQAKP